MLLILHIRNLLLLRFRLFAPRRRFAKFLVVTGDSGLDCWDVALRDVNTATCSLNGGRRGKNRTRNCVRLPIDDVGEGELVASEVLRVHGVVPKEKPTVGPPVHLVLVPRTIGGGICAKSFFRGIGIPRTGSIRKG